MKTIVKTSTKKHVEKLEKRLVPPPETAFSRQLMLRLKAGLERVRIYREAHGLIEPVEVLPPEPADATRGMTEIQVITRILHRGRKRNYLRSLGAEELAGRSSRSSASGSIPLAAANIRLAHAMAWYYDDPLGFVLAAYPWGVKGTSLENESGPDENQTEFLTDLGAAVKARGFNGGDPVMPILMNVSSGHGTGKSVLGAWIADWILSTRPHSIGTITANTIKQLENRTWAEVQRWTKLCMTAHWFDIQMTGIYATESAEDWKVVMQTCREENSQSFAGQHAKNSTSWYLFDEASDIPDSIWDVAFGGLTDGEPMFFAWGQPTKSNGKFHEITFGSQRNRWDHRTIDSRTSRFTNKALMAQWCADNGEDSDYFRVRVLGLPPRASDLQYIDSDRIFAAQNCEAFHFEDDPLVVGLDVARGGKANSVFRFRRGMDARSIPPIRISGEDSRDSMVLVTKLLQVMDTEYGGVKPAPAFVDSGFGGPIVDRCRQLGFTNVIEVRFGATCSDPVHYANKRAWMWSQVREFLQRGAIDKDPRLATDLAGPAVKMDKQDRICLESKEEMEKRGLDSPDDGDALALTFAQYVAPVPKEEPDEDEEYGTGWGNILLGGHYGWTSR